jgi:arsenate reductase
MMADSKSGVPLLPVLHKTVKQLTTAFHEIPNDRKERLLQLTAFIQQKVLAGKTVNLNFICTHNSRRSHIAQLWAQAASYYYGLRDIQCFSGGTEATAFNPRAVKAMEDAGFRIEKKSTADNPVYEVHFSEDAAPLEVFSKKYDALDNPVNDFVAIMTCSHADQNCPLVTGAVKRIAITYDDPKDFDDTPEEQQKYRERALQIGREMLFAFSKIALHVN